MTRFALMTIRDRTAGFAGAFFALLFAAALVCACGVLLETGLRGQVRPERYAGTPVLVAGDQNVRETIKKDKGDGEVKTKVKAKPLSERAWVPASLADRLAGVSGVRSVVAEVTFPVHSGGATFTGHGWESAKLTPFTLREGRTPEAAGEAVADAASGLSVGARLTVEAVGEYRVVGVTAEALESERTLFFGTAEAHRLAGLLAGRADDRVSAIGVFPEGDLATVLKGVNAVLDGSGALTYTGVERGAVEFLDAEKARVKLISLGGALGGTSLLVAILVVVGTFALSIQQRQREIALLRAVAATPRQIRKMLGGEALIIGLVAGISGAALGVGLAFWLRSRFVDLGAMPPNLDLVLSPFPVFAALGATVLAAWAAARLSARRTVRIRPVEALGEAALRPAGLPWGRLMAGLLCVGGAITLTLVLSTLSSEAASSPVTMLTALVWTTAVALLGPVVARVAVAVLGAPMRAFRVGGHLAAANLRAGTARLAAVVTPLSLMVAMTCTILFVQTTMGHAAQEQARAGTRADLVLGPRVPEAAADAVRKVPGVTAVTEVLRTSVRVGLAKYGAQGVTPAGLTSTVDLDVREGSLDRMGSGTLALSGNAAAGLDASVGDRVALTLGDGTPATLTVVAVYARGLGFADVTLPHDLVAAHVDDPLARTVFVAAPSVDRAAVAAALRDHPGVRVLDRVEAVVTPANAEVNYVAMGLIIAFTAIAVVNTIAMATCDRSRELALLRLVGATRRQIMRTLRWETSVALLVAVALGTGVASVTLSAFSAGMTGSATPYVPLVTYLAIVAAVAALALTATVLPARMVLRARPADVIGARE
ncbi:FtsX-like permease family protein [Microtetraspora fusca]|uniref:FtsX-like permease family protein n=1 Tax=Microtetraspora fusca TaxID=1997 RepID=UPI000AEEC05F|nr:ABC transporter permease [Microtetraspora fusca]